MADNSILVQHAGPPTKRCREGVAKRYIAVPRYTNSTALMQPSFSGLLVIWAYLPQTTLPEGVTRPRSAQLTSMTVPLVITPRDVYRGDLAGGEHKASTVRG